ncbi:MAG: hypothetical protein EOP04_11645 [Proteobacteria bacterium]|nr:MAG: hypothetical protein EOP04_11645 [Pseudomonadota bacterium]
MWFRIVSLTVSVFLFSTACKSTGSQSSISKGLISNDYRDLWPNRSVEVCWADSKIPNLTRLQKYLEENVVREYARARINIVGWKGCPQKIQDPGPYPIYLNPDGENYTSLVGYGARIDGININVYFDLFAGLPNNCTVSGQSLIRQECILGTTLHEMGHFVGLSHEHERTDTGRRCHADTLRGSGIENTQVGDYDPKSIMNYCSDNEFAFHGIGPQKELSVRDVATIESLYSGNLANLVSDAAKGNLFLDQAQLIIKVSGQNVSSYRYQVVTGPKDRDLKCKREGYGKELAVSEQIVVNLKPISSGSIKICALGKDIKGNEQSEETYSSLFYFIDRTPTAKLVGKNEFLEEEELPSHVQGVDVETYSFKFIPDASEEMLTSVKNEVEILELLNPCLSEKGYGEPRAISVPLDYSSLKRDSIYTLCVRGISAKGVIQTLEKATKFSFQTPP